MIKLNYSKCWFLMRIKGKLDQYLGKNPLAEKRAKKKKIQPACVIKSGMSP